MTNETKNTIMQALHKISGHCGLHTDAPAGFKKRDEVLERLKAVNEEAWNVASAYVNAHIKSDRIQNDAEKKLKKPEHWAVESQAAEQEMVVAEEKLNALLK